MSEKIYYNLSLTNSEPNKKYKPAKHTETRTQSILNNTGRYEMSCTSFNIPSSNIPLFIFEEATGIIGDYSQGYWVTVGNTTNEYTINVKYEPKQNLSDIGLDSTYEPFKRAIFDYSLFVEQVNTALYDAFILLGYVAIDEPFISYNGSKFELYIDSLAPGGWYNGNLGDNYIYFNQALHNFFYFPAQYVDSPLTFNGGKDYKILFINTKIYKNSLANPKFDGDFIFNDNEMSILTQTVNTLANWATYRKIIFYSNNIPVRRIQIVNEDIAGVPSSANVLTSYLIPGSAIFDRSDFTFNPTVLNWLDLENTQNLKTLDIEAKIQGKNSNDLLPFYIGPSESFQITLCFRSKVKLIQSTDNLHDEILNDVRRLHSGGRYR